MQDIFDIITEHGDFNHVGTIVRDQATFLPITVYSVRSVDRILSVFNDVPFSGDLNKSSYISYNRY